MLRGLRTVVFRVRDLEASKRWYRDAVGKDPYFDQPFYVGFDVEGYELGLTPEEGAGAPGATAYWAVDDIAAARARLIERGASEREVVTDVGEGIEVASVVDPFGNALGLIYNPHFAPRLTHADAGDVAADAIVKSARVPVAREQAYRLWSTSAGLAEWWTAQSRLELRPGGAYELYFFEGEAPGRRGADGCRVLSFLPGRMLSFTWNAPPELPKTRPLFTWVVLTFDDDADGGALVTLSHLGWPRSGLDDEASEWPATLRYFDDAWGRVMARFGEHCRTRR